MRYKANFFIIAILVGLSGCSLLGHRNDSLRLNRAKWAAQGLSNYTFELQVGCFCTIAPETPALVTVRGDSVVSATRLRDSSAVSVDQLQYLPTIEALFDIIQDADDRDAHSVDTEYDSRRGFPSSVLIDYIENAVDDEISYAVSNVHGSIASN